MSKPFKPTFSYVRIMKNNIKENPLPFEYYYSNANGLYTYQWTEKVRKTEKKLKDLQSKIGHEGYDWCILEKVISGVGFYNVTPPPLTGSYTQFKWDFQKDGWTKVFWRSVKTIKGVDARVWQDGDTLYVIVLPSPETIEWLNKVAADVPREF